MVMGLGGNCTRSRGFLSGADGTIGDVDGCVFWVLDLLRAENF
jgi:hypothetical protein